MLTLTAPGVQLYLRHPHRRTRTAAAEYPHRRAIEVAIANSRWLGEVQRRWPVSRIARVAAILAGLAQQRTGHTVTLDATTVRHLLLQAHVRPPGLQRILHQLVAGGLLTRTPCDDPAQWGSYTLTTPGPTTAPCLGDPARRHRDQR